MPKVTTNDGVELAYRIIGEGNKDIVLVHGWMMSGAVYDDLIREISLPGYRFIVPDQRATGYSSKDADDFSLARQVEDIRTVVDDAGAEHFGLIGHSMGGQIAQLFAATYPERVDRLVALCSVPASGAPLSPEIFAIFENSGGNRQAQAEILSMASVDLPEGALERLCDIAEPIPAEAIQKTLYAWTQGGFEDQLENIDAPTLVVTSDDPFLPVEFLEAAIASQIAGAEMAHIDGSGHYAQVERCAPTARAIERFFNS